MEPVTLQSEKPVITRNLTNKCDRKQMLHSCLSHCPTIKSSSSPHSDGCTDGTMASSSNDSHYSGSRVETPVSYMGDDDDEDEYDENDDED